MAPEFAKIFRQLDLLFAFLLIFLAIFWGTNLISPVRFDKERIEVWVADGQVQVRGLYHYRNQTFLPLSFSLGLPFPVDSDHPAPPAFSVAEVNSSGEFLDVVNVRSYHGSHVFRLNFWPKQEKWIRLDYVQTTLTDNATYILRTTRKWNQPLDNGEYLLHLSNGLSLAFSTYPLKQLPPGEQTTYFFSRAHFFPSEDWSFFWNQMKTNVASKRDHL